MALTKKRKELSKALLLNGHVSASTVDELAALMELEVGCGDARHSSRTWQRTLRRDIALPDLYYT